MSQLLPTCPECNGLYSCKPTCSLAQARTAMLEEVQTKTRLAEVAKETAKGEKIAEGEDGVYIRTEGPDADGEPIIVAFNQGGHDCTIVAVKDVLAWVRAKRPDLLR